MHTRHGGEDVCRPCPQTPIPTRDDHVCIDFLSGGQDVHTNVLGASNPSSICFVFEALLLTIYKQVTLEVLQEDVNSDEHLDEAALFFPKMSAVAILFRERLDESVFHLFCV